MKRSLNYKKWGGGYSEIMKISKRNDVGKRANWTKEFMKFYFLHALKSNYELLQNVLQIVISDKRNLNTHHFPFLKLKSLKNINMVRLGET